MSQSERNADFGKIRSLLNEGGTLIRDPTELILLCEKHGTDYYREEVSQYVKDHLWRVVDKDGEQKISRYKLTFEVLSKGKVYISYLTMWFSFEEDSLRVNLKNFKEESVFEVLGSLVQNIELLSECYDLESKNEANRILKKIISFPNKSYEKILLFFVQNPLDLDLKIIEPIFTDYFKYAR